jgi:hypothetical protein
VVSGACSCYGGECAVYKERGPHVTRKAGHDCFVCGAPVLPGDLCKDVMWLDVDGGGGFRRSHEACFTLRAEFGDEVCGGEWGVYKHGTWELGEAAEHAFAQGDDTFWRSWLELYEMTWLYTPEQERATGICASCITFRRCQTLKGVDRWTKDCAWFPSRYLELVGKEPRS